MKTLPTYKRFLITVNVFPGCHKNKLHVFILDFMAQARTSTLDVLIYKI